MDAICLACGQQAADHEQVMLIGPQERELLCTDCFSAEASTRLGIEAPRLPQQVFCLRDAAGKLRQFMLGRRQLESGIMLSVDELGEEPPAGYSFTVQGTMSSQAELLERLLGLLQEALAQRYTECRTKSRTAEPIATLLSGEVKGRLTWDKTAPRRAPLVVIDGHPYTWAEFGKMLAEKDGCRFHLKLQPMTDQLD